MCIQLCFARFLVIQGNKPLFAWTELLPMCRRNAFSYKLVLAVSAKTVAFLSAVLAAFQPLLLSISVINATKQTTFRQFLLVWVLFSDFAVGSWVSKLGTALKKCACTVKMRTSILLAVLLWNGSCKSILKMPFSACLLSRKVAIEAVRNFASSDTATLVYKDICNLSLQFKVYSSAMWAGPTTLIFYYRM